MKQNDCIWETDRIFYKHEIDETPECDQYSLHTHNAYELLYIVSGDATHIIEDRRYKLKKGDLIIIRPFHYHFIGNICRLRCGGDIGRLKIYRGTDCRHSVRCAALFLFGRIAGCY